MEQYGECKYCGAMIIIKCPAGASEEQLNEAATENCKCEQARTATQRKHEIVKARERIEKLFGESATDMDLEPIRIEKLLDMLDEAVVMLVDSKIRSLSIDIDSTTKVKMSVNAKGRITVQRGEAVTYKLEA